MKGEQVQFIRRLLLAVSITVASLTGVTIDAAVACHDNAEEHWEWQEEWGYAYPPGDPVYNEPIGDPEEYPDSPNPEWQWWNDPGW